MNGPTQLIFNWFECWVYSHIANLSDPKK